MERRELLTTYTVLNTDNDGAGSLRQAILDANANVGQDTIDFNIGAGGFHSIAPLSVLPSITDPVFLDATTQPGYAGQPLIELNGAGAGKGFVPGLTLQTGASTVRGLAINRFSGNGVTIYSDANRVLGCVIGTDAAGTQGFANLGNGVEIRGRNNVIGSAAVGGGNLISGNGYDGVIVARYDAQPSGNQIIGNRIGTDATGTAAIANGLNGVAIYASGCQVGGANTAEGNTIAYNILAGVRVGSYYFDSSSVNNLIRANSIFRNGGLGIDLGGDGPDYNDYQDFDSGPNNRQNSPALAAAYVSGAGTVVVGSLSARPNVTYTIDFYSDLEPDPSGFGEGRVYLGSTSVTADGFGIASFDQALPTAVPAGQYVSATATDSASNTSEFARTVPVTPTATSDLSVILNAPSSARVGETFTYYAYATNNGPIETTGTTLEFTLPAGVVLEQVSPDRGDYTVNGQTITIEFGDLASGSIVGALINVHPTEVGVINAAATVKADQTDPTPGNNSRNARTTVEPELAANLAIVGFPDSNSLSIGDEVVFTFVVINNGPNPTATGVTATATLPDGLEPIDATVSRGSSTISGKTVTASFGQFESFVQPAVRIRARATLAGLASVNALVRGDQEDPNDLDNSTRVDVMVNPPQAADLAIGIQATPDPVLSGQLLTYTVLVTNNGPGDSTDVVVNGQLPQGVTVVGTPQASQGTVTITGDSFKAQLGSLPAGLTSLITIGVRPVVAGVLVASAQVSAAQADSQPTNNLTTIATSAIADPVLPIITAQNLVVDRKGIQAIVLTFNKPLEPVLSTALANYSVTLHNGRGPAVSLASATYDEATRSVRLTPQKPMRFGPFYKLTVNGEGAPGVVDLGGTVLDGDYNGLQDGIFTSRIGRGTSTRPNDFQRGPVGVDTNPVVTPPTRRTPATRLRVRH